MRLAYFSPLPPSKSGIADYSSELLPVLSRGAEISVFVENEADAAEHASRGDYRVYPVARFEELHNSTRFELCIYHQGNNPYHEYIYDRALRTPGLVVLHEHCLHHLIAWKTLGRDNEESYWDEMFFAYGRSGSEIARMRSRDCGSDYQQFIYPLNRRLVSSSLGVIVHNEYAASQIETLNDTRFNLPRVEVIHHHLSPRIYEMDTLDRTECRRALGIPADAWVIASFGFVTFSKRIPVLLRAFKKLLDIVPNARCLIVGEDHWKWSVAPVIREMGLEETVQITGYTSEPDFFRYLKAVDAVVNLRYPTAGETSGTLIRALGAGKPVVVSHHGQFGEIPDRACRRVTPGPDEEKELFSQLRDLAWRPEVAESIGREASEWARTECDLVRSAGSYLNFAERLVVERRKAGGVPAHFGFDLEYHEPGLIQVDRYEAIEYVRAFFEHDADALGYLDVHQDRLVRTVELLPVGSDSERLLELSSYLQMTTLIKRYGRYGEIAITNWWQDGPAVKMQHVRNEQAGEELTLPMQNVDVERDRFPYPDAHFDVALCCELIEHLAEDPMHMLLELNRVLKWAGLLVLTTPNIASAFSIREALAGSSPYIYGSYNRKSRSDRHSREYTPKDVRLALESAGFKVVKLFTADLWQATDERFLTELDHTGVPRDLRGDNIFAVGRKMSAQTERYPELLYD
jgi:glycosyltransferase involved in cell wall biosynthesis/SAM-dependent methyltransferase